MIDLHTHSTASDGSHSPRELVTLAARAGITRLSLTDHDTVDGLGDARSACQSEGIKLINGIELSTRWQNRTLHVVGLDIDPKNAVLVEALRNAQQTRTERGARIGKKLEQSGIPDAYALTCSLAGSNLIGRSHFARFLVAHGYAKDFKQVFKRYMIKGRPGYAAAEWIGLESAVKVIHQAGGIAVIAHPTRYGLTRGQLRRLAAEFSDSSGDAMEVVSGNAATSEVENMARLANAFNLAASAGSDFHGPDKPWIKLGQLRALPASCRPVWALRDL